MLFRLGAFGVVPLILLALWIYCILDVIATDDALVRNLSKGVWLLIVIFLPDIGSLAWLLGPSDVRRLAPGRHEPPPDEAGRRPRGPRRLSDRPEPANATAEATRITRERARRLGGAAAPPGRGAQTQGAGRAR